MPLVGLPLVALTGQVKGLTRYLGSRALYRLAAPQQLDPALVTAVGEAGAQLAAALRPAGNHQIVSFLDDARSLWRRTINGIPIQLPQVLREIQAATLNLDGEMVRLSGLSLRDAQNTGAEIAIARTGLHPLIFRGQEEKRAPIS